MIPRQIVTLSSPGSEPHFTDQRSHAIFLSSVRSHSWLEHARHYWSICGRFEVCWSRWLERCWLFDDWRLDNERHSKPNWIQVREAPRSDRKYCSMSDKFPLVSGRYLHRRWLWLLMCVTCPTKHTFCWTKKSLQSIKIPWVFNLNMLLVSAAN